MSIFNRQTRSNIINLKQFNIIKMAKAYSMVLFGLLFVASIGLYLFEVNYSATKGYEIRQLQKDISAEKLANEKLQLQIIELRSMADLNDKISKLGMVDAGMPKYIDSNVLVARK